MTAQPFRIWHPAFDAYHCSFRLIQLLLQKADHQLAVPVLSILDFYLLYPFLLHRASMPMATKARFRALSIKRDRDYFIELPSTQSLFRDVAFIQTTALSNLTAKSILDRGQYLRESAVLNATFLPTILREQASNANEQNRAFMNFW